MSDFEIAWERGYKKGRADAIDEMLKYAFDTMCGFDENNHIGKYCFERDQCSATNCTYKYLENYLLQMKEQEK